MLTESSFIKNIEIIRNKLAVSCLSFMSAVGMMEFYSTLTSDQCKIKCLFVKFFFKIILSQNLILEVVIVFEASV